MEGVRGRTGKKVNDGEDTQKRVSNNKKNILNVKIWAFKRGFILTTYVCMGMYIGSPWSQCFKEL